MDKISKIIFLLLGGYYIFVIITTDATGDDLVKIGLSFTIFLMIFYAVNSKTIKE